ASDRRGSSGLSVYLPVEETSSQVGVNLEAFPGYADHFSDFGTASGWLNPDAALNSLLEYLAAHSGDREDEPDRFDAVAAGGNANNVRSAATNLGPIGDPGPTYDGLSLHSGSDDDWFKFQVTGGSTLQVVVTLKSAGGLTARLYDIE